MAATQAPLLRLDRDAHGPVIRACGRWTVDALPAVEASAAGISIAGPNAALDLSGIVAFDTAGAWAINRLTRAARQRGTELAVTGLRSDWVGLLDLVARNDQPIEKPPRENAIVLVLARVGRATIAALEEGRDLLGFFGATVVALAAALRRPSRVRLVPMIAHLEQVGFNALPIVGLISFLIGVVMAYQGASQLQRFGAEIFVADLVAVSVLREIGILLTAIVVAGRSGSAFTAQIGSMKMQQEIDAMRVIGIDPMEALILPRVIALVIALPLLAVFSDVMGLAGGALMAWTTLDIAPSTFLERITDTVDARQFWIGVLKAPVFAFLIALVGCRNGLMVRGSARSLGKHTTRAVVESIFLVIVLDAVFSIIFSAVGW